MTRREFILQILAVGASATVSYGKTATPGSSKGKQKSSNKQKSVTYMHVAISEDVLGVLFATDLVRHQTHFESRRHEHRYYLRLRPHSTNRFQLPYALDVIDYFFRDLDLSFVVSLPKPKGEKQANSKNIASDLTDVQTLEQRLLKLIRTGLALRAEGGIVASRRIIHRHRLPRSYNARHSKKVCVAEYNRSILSACTGCQQLPPTTAAWKRPN